MDLSHFHIQVRDISHARQFYEKAFEFQEDFVCDEKEVFLRNSYDFILGLEQSETPEALPKWFHFGFEAKSETKFREVYQRVKDLGVPIRRELKDFGDVVNFYCSDPDGNHIEVYFNRN